MIRSPLAVLAGYLAMVVLVGVSFALLTAAVPDAVDREEARVDQPWLTLMAASGCLWAGVGGWVTARVAGRAELPHGLGLAAFAMLMWMVYVGLAPIEQSTWFQIANLLLMVLGVLAGAGLRAVQVARRPAAP